MKKIIAIVLAVIFVVSLASCGISEEVYNAVVGERDAALAQIQTLESDLSKERENLTAAQSQIKTLESNLSSAESQITTLESELSAEQNKVKTLESDLAAEQSEVQKLEKEVSAAQSETQKMTGDYNAIKRKIDGAEPCAEILERYYFETEFEMSPGEAQLEISELVLKTLDAEIMEKWTNYLDSTTVRQAEERALEFLIAVWNGLWKALYPSGTTQ